MLQFFKDIEHSLNTLVTLKPSKEVIGKEEALAYIKIIKDEIKKEQNDWLKEIKNKVSDDLPTHLIGKKRPQTRLYPYKVSGDLFNKFSTEVIEVPLSSDYTKWRIITAFKNESKHTFFTDEGITKKGKKTSHGAWVNWWKKATYLEGSDIKNADTRLNDLMRHILRT